MAKHSDSKRTHEARTEAIRRRTVRKFNRDNEGKR